MYSSKSLNKTLAEISMFNLVSRMKMNMEDGQLM